MNEQEKNEWRERWEAGARRRAHGRVWTGLLLLIIGGFLLLRASGAVYFPGWFFSWPVLLIAIGMFSGLRHGFRGPFWLIMIFIGAFSLVDRLNPQMDLDRFIWPVVFMAIGLVFILRPKRSHCRPWGGPFNRRRTMPDSPDADLNYEQFQTTSGDRRDFLDVTAVFGGVKKNIVSKRFSGGDIVSFMGGSEIDMSQADFNGRVTIDATNIFGGTKLIVPTNWDVQSDITAIFGGVDDKRQLNGIAPDPGKLLILDGTCLFGGIEIRSF